MAGFSPTGALLLPAAATSIGLAWLAISWLISPVLVARRRTRALHHTETTYIVPAVAEGDAGSTAPFDILQAAPAKLLSVVVPAYNEVDRLPDMLDVTLAYLEAEASRNPAFTYEVLVVDDGSTDTTSKVALDYSQRLGTDVLRVCTLRQNMGKGAAIREGMLRMRGRYALMADADAAADIEDLGRLLAATQQIQANGLGVGIGSRAHIEAESVATRAWYRTIMMRVFHWCVVLLCSKRIRDTQCGFKLFTRQAAHVLFTTLHLERWAFDIELVYLCERFGIPMVEVAVTWHEVPGSKLITSKLDIITTSLTMLRDMLCVRVCYTAGIWKICPTVMAAAAAAVAPAEVPDTAPQQTKLASASKQD
ncbi:Dolichyl-phosphate beta-glucosyltransferase, family GT2 [Tribonema minus]|uniref:dolichyl-phosphate beta-glucosyltransferase n=1 Tax=Tribonema minus TaxID=303371 RepID=A0A835ZBS6_9STRA|nr:Dolichyl-phosphate beta-glucosyltransferase, family GT2 [Tribonema minus]